MNDNNNDTFQSNTANTGDAYEQENPGPSHPNPDEDNRDPPVNKDPNPDPNPGPSPFLPADPNAHPQNVPTGFFA
jgi:hypothetical protein